KTGSSAHRARVRLNGVKLTPLNLDQVKEDDNITDINSEGRDESELLKYQLIAGAGVDILSLEQPPREGDDAVDLNYRIVTYATEECPTALRDSKHQRMFDGAIDRTKTLPNALARNMKAAEWALYIASLVWPSGIQASVTSVDGLRRLDPGADADRSFVQAEFYRMTYPGKVPAQPSDHDAAVVRLVSPDGAVRIRRQAPVYPLSEHAKKLRKHIAFVKAEWQEAATLRRRREAIQSAALSTRDFNERVAAKYGDKTVYAIGLQQVESSSLGQLANAMADG
ncbi:hypothetical protein PybrP1_011328, partial [[Pythium] brassicae (nom. inval.)]